MSFTRIAPAGLIGKVHQRIAMNSTATLLNTTCQGCTAFFIGVEGAGARVRFEWVNSTTTPITANTGVLLTSTTGGYFFDGIANANKMKFARNASGAILQVSGFNNIADKVSA